MQQQLKDFLEAHAISEEVGLARPYVRYEKGETSIVEPYFEGFDPKCGKLGRDVAGQSGGYLIVRNPAPGADPIPAQSRPDAAVYTNNLRMPSYHPSNREAKRVPLRKKDGSLNRTKDGGIKFYSPLKDAVLERHLAKWHSDKPVHGETIGNPDGWHFHRRAAKYVLPPGEHGKRLDVHPFALEKIKSASRVFFVIEGSLKNDAILSQGEAVFCVPSVTLWDAPELAAFVTGYLMGKDIVIVPDADWVDNPLVITQAMMLREHLRNRFGLRVCVAAPPLVDDKVEIVEHPKFGLIKRKGVDDHLVLGGTLDELTVIEREARSPDVIRRALYPHSFRSDQLDRDIRAMRALPLYATKSGQLPYCISTLGTLLVCDRKTARTCIQSLAEAGVIEVEGSLAAGPEYTDKETGLSYGYDWEDRPRITIRPEFRAIEHPLTLEKWSHDRPVVPRKVNVERQAFGRSAVALGIARA